MISMIKLHVVAAILIEGDKILAVQRGKGRFKGGWEFPGGKVEEGESEEEALHRELMEELVIQVKIDRRFDSVEYDYDDFHLSMDCFICTIIGGCLSLQEHQNLKWLRHDELNTVEWLPADLDIIEKLKVFLK